MEPLSRYEVLFQDSPEVFYVDNARMICLDGLLMFRIFNGPALVETQYYPLQNIHRIKKREPLPVPTI